MPAIMKPSQNQIAEVFLRTLGLERTGVGNGGQWSARGGATVRRVEDSDRRLVVRDGSGLSRNDLISPEAVVGILDVMRRSPNFDLFFESLPIAGVDGTIRTRMKGTPAEGNLHAKTGTLSMVRSLSGYVRNRLTAVCWSSAFCATTGWRRRRRWTESRTRSVLRSPN